MEVVDLGAQTACLAARVAALEALLLPVAVSTNSATGDGLADSGPTVDLSSAAAGVNRGSVWGSDSAAENVESGQPTSTAAKQTASVARPMNRRIATVIERLALSPCARSLRTIRDLLTPLDDLLRSVGLEKDLPEELRRRLDKADLEAVLGATPAFRALDELSTRAHAWEKATLTEGCWDQWATQVAIATPGSASAADAVSLRAVFAASEDESKAALPETKTITVDLEELGSIAQEAERALRLLERYGELQAKQVRFAAYVGDRLHRIDSAVRAREARVSSFAAAKKRSPK